MSSVELIANLNAHAVELMHRGQHRQASAVLITTLTDVYSMLLDLHRRRCDCTTASITDYTYGLLALCNNAHEYSACVSQTNRSNNSSESTSSPILEATPTPALEECALVESELDYSLPSAAPASHELAMDDDLPPYYIRPFMVVPRNQTIPDSILHGVLAEISAVLLFNMALVNHREGIQSGTSASLQTALRLYHQSLSQLQVAAACVSPTSSYTLSERLVLLTAIHQNKAWIFMHFCDAVPARQEIQWLGKAVAHLEVAVLGPNGGSHEHTLPTPMLEDLHFFRLQLALMRMYHFEFAAAA